MTNSEQWLTEFVEKLENMSPDELRHLRLVAASKATDFAERGTRRWIWNKMNRFLSEWIKQ